MPAIFDDDSRQAQERTRMLVQTSVLITESEPLDMARWIVNILSSQGFSALVLEPSRDDTTPEA
jgi:hypothetical protein